MVSGSLYEMWRDDLILADKELTRWSVNPAKQRTEKNPTEFELYSDRHERLYSNYVLDERLRMRPGPKTKVANFEEIKDILLSTDLSRDSELDWTNDGLRFLDGADMSKNSVVFQSWPRSGNSMLRRYIETVTGIFTGADGDIFTSISL